MDGECLRELTVQVETHLAGCADCTDHAEFKKHMKIVDRDQVSRRGAPGGAGGADPRAHPHREPLAERPGHAADPYNRSVNPSSGGRRWVSLGVALLLVFGGMVFAIVKFAPCAFASSEAPFTSVVASVDRWLQADPPFPDTPDSDGTVVLEVSVREVGPAGDVGAVSKERVAIHGSFVGDIQDALDKGSRVFLAMTSAGFREEVSFVVARSSDGAHSFLGGCLWGPGSKSLREDLGPRFDGAISQIIGLTDSDAIYRVLAGVEEAPGRVLVEYEERPPDLRTFTRTGTLVERGRCLAIETDVGPLVPICRVFDTSSRSTRRDSW